MTTDNPQAVVVTAEIDIHQAIKAVVEFAEKYPAERISLDQVFAIDTAAETLHRRLREYFCETTNTSDHCLVCGAEIPPGPDFCSLECEDKWTTSQS